MQVLSSEPRRAPVGGVLFSYGFRPFFLGAGLLAAVALPLWVAMYTGLIALPGSADALRWHMHEMLFGYLGAALSGFLLTAVPNWTRRKPIAGTALAGLFGLWAAGRIAMLSAGGSVAADLIAAAYPIVLAAVIWREVLAGGNRRNIPVCVFVSGFAAAQALFLFGPQDLGLRLGLAMAVMMMMLIGGRVTPNFTANWFRQSGRDLPPVPFGNADKAALVAGALAMASWIATPETTVTGILFLAAGVLNAWRLGRWHGASTLREPLVLVLHVAYAWLPVSFALFAASILAPDWVMAQQPIHALTAGAIGQMTLAVMTRASLGHSGRVLHADVATTTAYVLVFLGAAGRVASTWMPDPMTALYLSAALWTGGYLAFLARFAPMLVSPRSD